MEMKLFDDAYRNCKVLITGHTGFKGSWLSLWLNELGANVTGLALDPETKPNHWDLLKLKVPDNRIDDRDFSSVLKVVEGIKPEIVFHLAAQPLVRRSYRNPLDTWSTNVIGTANVLEACRNIDALKAIVVITTDKVYEDMNWFWGYRENDRLGGHDPYSASKASSELVVDSYRKSFFNTIESPLVATARAGNVIGGGDWSEDRLVPDIMRALTGTDGIEIRSPTATRPWQHVLECLNGYLTLGKRLMDGDRTCEGAWNFGPNLSESCTVVELLEKFKEHFNGVMWKTTGAEQPHEADCLYLDTAKAIGILKWKPVWTIDRCVDMTSEWYSQYYTKNKIESKKQIREFSKDAFLSGCGE
jgi:CDP-glucose 4,6-dehydratase